MSYCHILLSPLLANEIDYSKKGLKYLTGTTKFKPMLNFNRQDFIHKYPVTQKGMSISGYQPKLQVILQNNQFEIIEHRGDFILNRTVADARLPPFWRRAGLASFRR